jgi:hypothetical protein
LSKYSAFIRPQLAEGEELLSRTVRMSSAADLGLHGREEVIACLGPTFQRLFIVTRNLKRGDTRPLHSYRYGSELTRGRDLFLRPKVELRGRGDREGMRSYSRGDAPTR